MGCSGISASWCPIHGDCICPRHAVEDWDDVDKHPELADSNGEHDDCPLHSMASTHGEVQIIETIWGSVLIEE